MKYIFSFGFLFLLTIAAIAQEKKTSQLPPIRTMDQAPSPKIVKVLPVRTSDSKTGAAGNKTGTAVNQTGAAVNHLTGNAIKPGPARGAAPQPSALSAKDAADLRKQQDHPQP